MVPKVIEFLFPIYSPLGGHYVAFININLKGPPKVIFLKNNW
jgi:hypothetical protein